MTSPSVSTTLKFWLLRLVPVLSAACCLTSVPAAWAESVDTVAMAVLPVMPQSEEEQVGVLTEPLAIDAEPLAVSGPLTLSEPQSVLDTSELPPGAIITDDRAVMPPEIIDVSSRLDAGMLMDDLAVEEMPYEASSGRWFSNGGWYVGGESLWMARSTNNRVNIAIDQSFYNTKFTTMAQPFGAAPGARATIGKSLGRDYLDRDRSIEFVYYGGMAYNDVDGRKSVGQDALYTPLAPLAPGFYKAGQYFTRFNSDFNSWEWDYKLRRRLGRDQLVMSPGGKWTRHAERGFLPALIVGTRIAEVNEDFFLSSTRPGTSTRQFEGAYRINTGNWLLGLNLGGELISQNEFYYWGLRGRAAPALTFASASQASAGVNTVDVGPPNYTGRFSNAYSTTRTSAGFIGDLTLMAGWNITPNFALQAGYDFLWVAGMATATRQFNLDGRDLKAIDVGGQTFYNGVSFGFNGSW